MGSNNSRHYWVECVASIAIESARMFPGAVRAPQAEQGLMPVVHTHAPEKAGRSPRT